MSAGRSRFSMTSRANSLGAAMITASPTTAIGRVSRRKALCCAETSLRPASVRDQTGGEVVGRPRRRPPWARDRRVGPRGRSRGASVSMRGRRSGSSSVVGLLGSVVASGTVGCTVEPPSRVRERASSSVRGGGMHPHEIRHPHRRPQGVYGWWCERCCDVLWCQCGDHRSRDPSHRDRLRTSRCPQILRQSARWSACRARPGGVGPSRWSVGCAASASRLAV